MTTTQIETQNDSTKTTLRAAKEEEDEKKVIFTQYQLHHINNQLENLSPQDVLRWAITTIPGLHQTTAFGLTGLVILDMIHQLYPNSSPMELVFVDTLYHFPQTLELVDKIKQKYPNVKLHIYKPQDTNTVEEFESTHGKELWKNDDTLYDYLVKVEPVNRAYKDLNINAALTGRRRSQGGQRGSLPIIEMTESGLLKINPLANWGFNDVKNYIDKHNVPYNVLLDQGYRSIGDWHSTEPVAEGEDERAGRWKGQQKTECGIHENSRFAQYLKAMGKQMPQVQTS